MKIKKLDENGNFIIRLDPGDEIISSFTNFASENNIKAARFNGLGVSTYIKIYHYDTHTNSLVYHEFKEVMEILSLTGNISLGDDDAPYVHAHIVAAGADARSYGGHLLEARVWPTVEAFIKIFPNTTISRNLDTSRGHEYFSWDLE